MNNKTIKSIRVFDKKEKRYIKSIPSDCNLKIEIKYNELYLTGNEFYRFIFHTGMQDFNGNFIFPYDVLKLYKNKGSIKKNEFIIRTVKKEVYKEILIDESGIKPPVALIDVFKRFYRIEVVGNKLDESGILK